MLFLLNTPHKKQNTSHNLFLKEKCNCFLKKASKIRFLTFDGTIF